jgi:Ca-activated chloride channel family protein
MLRFAHDFFLYGLFLLPLLFLFYLTVYKRKKKAMQRFGNLALIQKLSANTSKKRQMGKISLIFVAIVFMVFALARPQIGTKLEEVKREGIDIIVAMDVSKSMLAQDIPPSRLAKAKREVSNSMPFDPGLWSGEDFSGYHGSRAHTDTGYSSRGSALDVDKSF